MPYDRPKRRFEMFPASRQPIDEDHSATAAAAAVEQSSAHSREQRACENLR